MDAALLLGAAGVLVLSGKKSKRGRGVSLTTSRGVLANPITGLNQIGLDQSLWPDKVFQIDFASGRPKPFWPLITNHRSKFTISYRTTGGEIVGNGARRFMAKRGDAKYHTGIDLYASDGDMVVAMESGTIVNVYHFYHGAWALFIQCDSGLVINYGEVKRNSWKEFGLGEGSHVKRNQPIARIETMSGGSSMLHFETYMKPSTQNERYFGGATGLILNPTYYLLRAKHYAQKGYAFSGADVCMARAYQHMIVDKPFEEAFALEEKAEQTPPQDSVVAELNAQRFYRPSVEGPNRADGP